MSEIRVDAIKTRAGSVPKASDVGLNVSGTVLQVVSSTTNTPKSIASSTFVTTDHSVTITPSSTSSTILLTVMGGHAWNGNNVNKVRCFTIYRGSTDLGHGDAGVWTHYCNAFNAQPHAGSIVDSPNTTSATTYTVYGRGQDTSTQYYAVDIGGSGTDDVAAVTLTAMEIAG